MRPSIGNILFVATVLSFNTYSQELPPVQNFSPTEYNAGNQNWSISQTKDKLIYIANNDGLLEYNGAKWTSYPSPNETIVRSVKVIDDKIYTGCYMEFGFWERSNLGVLMYTSLSSKIDLELIEDEEFWKIIGIDEWVIFQSLNRIYIYNSSDGSVKIINTETSIINMFKIDETIYFQQIDRGIYRIENGQEVLFSDNAAFKADEVINIFKNQDGLLILTRHNGFYRYYNNRITEWVEVNSRLESVSIYNAIKLRNQNYALGTISDGLIYLDENGEIIYTINSSNGLNNNTVLSVFEDIENNIWLGLDNGVSLININSSIQVFIDKNGLLGSVYASAIYKSNLYLGTNQGLFFKNVKDATSDFEIIKGTEGQVWSLREIDDLLFCGHHKGTFIIDKGEIERVSSIPGTWNIQKLHGTDHIIQGNYDGLYILKKENGQWQAPSKLDGFNNSSRHFAMSGNQIFVDHEYKGIFILSVDDLFSKVVSVEVDTTLKGANSSIISYQGEIIYAYKSGLLKYNSENKAFEKDSILSQIYNSKSYVSGRIIPNKKEDQFWIFTGNNLTLVTSGNLLNVPKFTTIPMASDIRRDVVEYENIIDLGQNEYLLGTSNGYITFDTEMFDVNDFNIHISKIGRGIKKDHSDGDILIDMSEVGSFKHYENNFRIHYHTPTYINYLKPTYQTQLVGIYDVWSEWSSQSDIFYENLPPGDYVFNVRAKVGEKISENIASYQFRVAKPWYITNTMIAVYALCVILFSIFMHNVYRRYYKRQQQKLIEENKRELELAKLQNEKEIIRIKNEQLREDYKSKSKELAASIMSIVSKNQVLTQIKDSLDKIKDLTDISSVIKIIDRSLDHNKNWELFKEAFDNADSEFFKNLKESHPNLSPNDLKLCAYLRLNLSSKEIAHLINISPRSVEIKRYRLRKKLNLANEENLTNYILSI